MKKILGILIIIIAVITFACMCQASEITFAHLSDIHIPSLPDENNNPTGPEVIFKDAINNINNTPGIDFTVITGDVLNSPNEELFTYIMKTAAGLKQPWYYTIGNHDTVTWGYMPKSRLIEIVKKVNSNYTFDSKDYAFQPKKGFTVIGLDGIQNNDTENTYAHISDEQKAFLNKVLTERKNDTILIFMHTPLLPPIDLPGHEMVNRDEIFELLSHYKQPIAIFAGHYHVTKIIQKDNILHVASPSLCYSQEYRIVNVKNKGKKVIFDLKYKEAGPEELRQNNSRYAGEEQDKNGIYILER